MPYPTEVQMNKTFIIRRQRGFALIQVALALALFSAAVTYEMYRQYQLRLDRESEVVGQGIGKLRNVLEFALVRDADKYMSAADGSGVNITINKGTPSESIVGIANWNSPSIAEIANLNVGLAPGFNAKAPNGGNYRISFTKSPAGCAPANCNLEGLVWVDKAIMGEGNASDSARAGIALRAIGIDGARSTVTTPGTFTGWRGGWSVPNPTGVPGIIAGRFGYGSSSWAAFFRLDGSRALSGDADFGGNSLKNAKQLLTVAKTVGDACSDLGALAGGVVAGKGTAMVCKDNTWQPAGGKTAIAGSGCAPEGTIATSQSSDESLVCKKGNDGVLRYVRLVNLIAKNVEVSRLNVVDGQVVIKPICDAGGVPDYSFNMNRTTVDVSVSPPKQAQYVTTVDNGASWSVVLRLRADNGAEASGNAYSLSALMHLECKY